jgi:hypothetical protein
MSSTSLLFIDFFIGFSLGSIIALIILVCLLERVQHSLRLTLNRIKQFSMTLFQLTNNCRTTNNINAKSITFNLSTSWMYELRKQIYEPLTFRLSMAHLCCIEIRQQYLLIFRSNNELDRKLTDSQLNSTAHFDNVDIYDLTEATIGLMPMNMIRSKYWSKKFPIILRHVIHVRTRSVSSLSIDNECSMLNNNNESRQRLTLTLFTRTRRSKEHWFYRFIHAAQLNAWQKELQYRVEYDELSNECNKVSRHCFLFHTYSSTMIRVHR